MKQVTEKIELCWFSVMIWKKKGEFHNFYQKLLVNLKTKIIQFLKTKNKNTGRLQKKE